MRVNSEVLFLAILALAIIGLVFCTIHLEKLKKVETFSIRTYNEHSYVFYSIGENRSITHNPDCPCQK